MLFIDHLKRIVEQDVLPKEVAEKYLSVYLEEADWAAHINTLYSILRKRYANDTAVLKTQMKQAISCALLLPVVDRTTYVDRNNPQNLLFKCVSYHQFNERDWFSMFKEEVKQDLKVTDWRNKCLSVGIIDPIDIAPYTRQAYNWLFSAADRSKDITDENKKDISDRMRNLVWAYGGLNICNMFSRYQDSLDKKVVNWRTGYFFEKDFFNHYTIDQVLKIKKAELEKTNKKLVKKIG